MTAASEPKGDLVRDLVELPLDQALALLRAQPRAAPTLMDLGDEVERATLTDLVRARVMGRRAVELADALDLPEPRVRARRALAQACAYANEFAEALGLLEQATTLASEHGLELAGAGARLSRLHALARLGRLDEAVDEGRLARAAFAHAGDGVQTARADINLGVVLRMRGEPAAAEEAFARARPLLDHQPMMLAQLESNAAEAMLDQCKFAQADLAFARALELFEQAGAKRAAGIVEGNIADLGSRQGRLDRALRHFERARRLLGEGDAPGDAARLDVERGEALATLGMLGDAEEAYTRAIPVLRERKMTGELARGLIGLGYVLASTDRAPQAHQPLAEAAGLFQGLNHPAGLSAARLAQAHAARTAGHHEEARGLLAQAMAGLEPHHTTRLSASVLLAEIEAQAHRLDRAAQLLDEAWPLARDAGIPTLEGEVLRVRAGVHRLAGRLPQALADLRLAMDRVEQVRGSLPADRLRAAFLDRRSSVYADAASTLLDLGAPEHRREAFEAVERGRARSLLDLLRDGVRLGESVHEAPTDSQERELLAELVAARGEANALHARAFERKARGAGDDALAATLAAREVRARELEQRLSASRAFAGVFAQPEGLARVQASLGEDEALIEYVLEGANVSAFVVTRADLRACRSLAPLERVASHADGLAFQVSRAMVRGFEDDPSSRLRRRAEEELAALHRLLIAPLGEFIARARRLSIAPTGPLHAVPFPALLGDDGYLLEHSVATLVPSASTLVRLAARGAPVAGPVVVVGVGDDLAPHAEDEARAIADLFPERTLLVGAEASVGRVVDAMRSASMVHIASHAVFALSDPLSSGVRLGDGWLSAREMYLLNLPGSRVVLNACDSGRSSVQASDDAFGLVRALIAGGAGLVISALWPVHDRTSRDFMRRLHEIWYHENPEDQMSLSDCLRRLQAEVARVGRHPGTWATFTATGRG